MIRKIIVMVLLVIGLLIPVALAESPIADAPYDWSILGTTAGAMAAVLLVVQFLKAPLDKIFKIPTRAFVYILSVLIMVGAQYFGNGSIILADLLPLLLNAVVVAMGAMGAYEQTFAKIDPHPPDENNR